MSAQGTVRTWTLKIRCGKGAVDPDSAKERDFGEVTGVYLQYQNSGSE